LCEHDGSGGGGGGGNNNYDNNTTMITLKNTNNNTPTTITTTTTTTTHNHSQHDAPATQAILSLRQRWVRRRGKRGQDTTRLKLAAVMM